jgi:hypothetical protein
MTALLLNHGLVLFHLLSFSPLFGPNRLSPTCILQQAPIDLRRRQMHIAHDTAADEDVLDGRQVRVFELVQYGDIVELDVQVLIDGLEGAVDANVVFQLDGDGVVC